MRAFGQGLMLTGLPVLGFLAVDYLIAPPSGNEGVEGSRGLPAPGGGVAKFAPSRSLDRRTAVADDAAEPNIAAPSEVITSVSKPTVADAASGGRPSLIASIQEELRRVGCYAGTVDGDWNGSTRTAMRAFIASVHVSLPADRPDYILLTLLQGHSSRACDRSIEARAVAPAASQPSETRTGQGGGESRPSAVVTPGRSVAQKSPWSTTIVNVAPSQVASGPDSGRSAPEVRGLGPAPVAVGEPLVREEFASSPPLPGRMAIGAMNAPGVQPGQDPAALPDANGLKPKPAVSPSPVRRSSPSESGGSSGRRHYSFTELSRSAP
jgi:hypothetical protein